MAILPAGNPNLRRSNRIRTIHGSLAIEQNTLSLEQITVVLNGKYSFCCKYLQVGSSLHLPS